MTRPLPADPPRRLALLLLALVSAIGCTRAEGGDPRPSLLLVSFDTTRYDHTSLSGYARDTTPNLGALAALGASFEVAYAPTSSTGPTHASLFTGVTPLRHGVTKNGATLAETATTLAERLAEANYRTGGFVSSWVIARRWGFAQGFADFDDTFERATSTFDAEFWAGQKVEGGFDRRAPETTQRAIAWLEANRDRGAFFLFVHYFDPHAPYLPPDGFRGRFETSAEADALARDVARYDEEIAFADAALGDLLAALQRLGRAGDTLVVATADHGEGLMDHGHMEHGVHVFDEQVRVPLVLRFPGRIPAGRRVDTPVSLVDVAPTVYELLGVEAPDAGFEGRSLVPALSGAEPPRPPRPVFLYRRHFNGERRADVWVVGEKFGVREGRFKYIDGPEERTRELFDLAADPKERENRVRAEPEAAAALAARIDAWRAGRIGPGGGKLEISPEERERLKALGYTE